jgi:hypothetical protein
MARLSLQKVLTPSLRHRARQQWQKARTPLYVWPAAACITTAAWTTWPQLGWLTAGIALLTIEALGGRGDNGGSGDIP